MSRPGPCNSVRLGGTIAAASNYCRRIINRAGSVAWIAGCGKEEQNRTHLICSSTPWRNRSIGPRLCLTTRLSSSRPWCCFFSVTYPPPPPPLSSLLFLKKKKFNNKKNCPPFSQFGTSITSPTPHLISDAQVFAQRPRSLCL